MKIIEGQLGNENIQALLIEHHQEMLKYSPPNSVHALDLSALQAPNITFWSIWINDDLAGCGALKELDQFHGEVKSMRTSSMFLRQGIAEYMLQHIIDQAGRRAYKKVSLETGSMDAFLPAQMLYQKFGFRLCEPFSGYTADPYSIFMTKDFV